MEIFVQLLLNGLIAGSLYSLLAIGFNLFYGTVKFFDLAFGTIALVGSYATLSFLKNLDLPLLISVMGGILVGAVLNVIIYKLVYVPIRARKGSNMVLLVTSLGVFTILQSLLAILFSSQFQTLRSAGYVPHIFHIYGASVTSVQVLMIALAVLVPIVMHFILKRTKSLSDKGGKTEVAKTESGNTAGMLAASAGIGFIASFLITGYTFLVIFLGFLTTDKWLFDDGKEAYVLLDFLHCAKLLVKEGDTVKTGQPIALADNTGFTTGPHLHIQPRRVVFINGAPNTISAYRFDNGGAWVDLDKNDANNSFDPEPYWNKRYAEDVKTFEEVKKQIEVLTPADAALVPWYLRALDIIKKLLNI